MEHVFSIMGYLETGLGRQADLALVNLIMLLVTVAPLFSLPFIMKAIGGIAQQLGAIAQNRSKGIFDRTRNLGGKLSGAQKGYYQRKGTEYAAKNYNPRAGRFSRKNLQSMIAARKLGVTRRQQLALGSAADKYEAEQIEMAEKFFSQQGKTKNKEELLKEVANSKNSVYTRLAAARLAGEAGATYELEDLYYGRDVKDAAGNVIPYQKDQASMEDLRKVVSRGASMSGKVSEMNTPFADQAKKYTDMLVSGQDAEVAWRAANKERADKTRDKVNANYVMNQKPKPQNLAELGLSLGATEAEGRAKMIEVLNAAKKSPTLSTKMTDTHHKLLADLEDSTKSIDQIKTEYGVRDNYRDHTFAQNQP